MITKKHLTYVLVLAVVTVSAIIVCLRFDNEPPAVEPQRMMWKGGDSNSKAKLNFLSHHIQRRNTRLTVKRKKETSTIHGITVNEQMSGSDSRSLILEPGLDGNYILDFFALIDREDKGKTILLRQLDSSGNTVNELSLDDYQSVNSFQRFQVSITLKKKHRLELRINNGQSGFIGRPVLYPAVKENKRRYVFLIVADTLRWNKLGVYDHALKTSPRIDAFAKDAVVFEQAYSTAPWTLPAHMSMFTGLFPDKHHVHYGNNTLPKGVKSLVEMLGRRFLTYSFNESHFVSARFGFDRGFDIYTEMQNTKPRAKAKRLFDKARQWIEMEKSGSAFFFLHTYQLHHPYYPEIKLANEYYRLAGPDGFNKNLVSIYDFIDGGKDIYRDADEDEKEAIERVYEAGVYTFDYRFGQFIEYLIKRGIYDQSMIILLSDHGEEFHDHGGWEHSHSLYNELIKIPLIVKFPDNRYAGQKIERLASICDILPGVMDVFQIQTGLDYSLDGRSIKSIVEHKENNRNFLLAYLAPNALRIVPQKIALISDGLKFIYNSPRKEKDIAFFKTPPPEIPGYEMYDIFKDPLDRTNVLQLKKKWLPMFIKHVKSLTFKRGKKGFLKGMEKDLKTLGYL